MLLRVCHPAPSSNVIMQELRKKNVKILSEKVLLLLNRGGKKKKGTFFGFSKQPELCAL